MFAQIPPAGVAERASFGDVFAARDHLEAPEVERVFFLEFGQLGDCQPHITPRNRLGRGVGVHLVDNRDFIIMSRLVGDQARVGEGFVVGGFEFEPHREPRAPYGEPPVPDDRIEFYLFDGVGTS